MDGSVSATAFPDRGWFTLSTSLAVVLGMSAVIGYGGSKVLACTLSLGSLVAFYSFVTQLFDPLSGAAELYSRAQKLSPASGKCRPCWQFDVVS